MDFKELYEKVRGIVLKCRREYYVHLWELSDWAQVKSERSVSRRVGNTPRSIKVLSKATESRPARAV